MRKIRNVRFLAPREELGGVAATGISLHCHTLHSKESMDFVPYYAERIPLVAMWWRRELRRNIKAFGRVPDFKTGYWTPPLTGKEVFDMESASMESLGLGGIVSITDHDSIAANLEVRENLPEGRVPISMEWTVPFGDAFFHVGIHNLPAARAGDLSRQLLDYTHAEGEPDNARLHELFSMLNECEDVLVVLNHPIWDIEMIGQARHEAALALFVDEHAQWIHAIEINGFRAWQENETAAELANSLGLPIISGGDRHCLHSNTMINLSDASSFSEFVHEIRVEQHSEIAVTPDYHVPLPSRQLASIAEVLGNFKHFPAGRRLWSDRVYLEAIDGSGLRTLTEQWNGRQPLWTGVAFSALALLGHPMMRPVIALAVGDKDIGREERPMEKHFLVADTPAVAEP